MVLVGSAKNPVASGDRDGHRLLEIDCLAGFQRRDGVLLMQRIRRANEHGVEILASHKLAVIVGEEFGPAVVAEGVEKG